jgi:hypothetical protein
VDPASSPENVWQYDQEIKGPVEGGRNHMCMESHGMEMNPHHPL